MSSDLRLRRLAPHLFVVLAYLAAAVVFTWPLAAGLGSHVVNGGDSWQAVWNFWLLKHTIFDLQRWPLETEMVYWPGGASLYQHTLDLDTGLLFLPVTALAGPVLSYNLASIFVCVATGYTMYLLARYLTGSHLAGFVAGFALTFSAWHISRLWGQMNLASLQWMPLYMLFLVRREGRWWVNALGAGISLALTILAGWYLALYLGVFALLWTVNRGLDRALPGRERLAWLGRTVASSLLAAVATMPLVLGLLAGAGSRAFALPLFVESVTFSADLLAYFAPPRMSTFFGGLVRAADINYWGSIEIEKLVFPGWSLWVLAFYALARRLPRSRVWLNLALVGWLLSFGPALHAGGQLATIGGAGVLMPYIAFYQLPGVEVSRTPVRFALLVLIALAVLAAYGLADLLRRSAARQASKPKRLSPAALLASGVVVLVALEQMIAPLPVASAAIPPFYHTLAADPGRYALLEAPIADFGVYHLYQTAHAKPIVGGYLSRSRIDPFIEGSPGVRAFKYPGAGSPIAQPAAPGGAPGEAAAARALLQSSGVRYIILHKGLMPPEHFSAMNALAAQISTAPAAYEDGEIIAYGVEGAPEEGQVILQLGAGWKLGAPEEGARTMAWADQGAELLVAAFRPQRVRVEIDARSFGEARQVTLLREREPLATWTLSAGVEQLRSAAFEIPAGTSRLTLASDRPADPLPKPSPYDKGQDRAILEASRIGIGLER